MDDFKKDNRISDDELDRVSGGRVRPGTFCSECGREISGINTITRDGLCPSCYAKYRDSLRETK